MARVNAPIYSLNGGEVGDEGLARLDLERLQFAGSLYENILPRVIGSMTIRPGLEHITNIDFGDVQLIEYSYSGTSTLIPILSDGALRVVKDNALVTRAAVATTVQNGDFASFTGWTDASAGAATAGVGSGDLRLTGTVQDSAVARQTISVALADRPIEQALVIDVQRGPVTVKVGSSAGSSSLLLAQNLEDGVHSLSFTPNLATIYLELSNDDARQSLVESCQFAAAGPMVIPAPWTDDDLVDNIIRYEQHKDVIYVASSVYQQRELKRHGDTSWGLQRYKVADGPFVVSDGKVSITPNVFTGNGTLTANRSYFDAGMVGRLFRLFQNGQTVIEGFTSDPAEGASIRVSGVGSARRFAWEISGTWSGTATLQVATDDGSGNPGAWTDLLTRTANDTGTYTDSDDNVIKYFRFAIAAGGHTSGTIDTRLAYSGGSQSGIVRVTDFNSATSVNMEVLTRLFRLNATFEWDYSTWSNFDGWPAAVDVFGGRLYWFTEDMVNGSVPDLFKSYDDEVEGASAPIARSVNSTSQRGVLWALGLQRLIVGTDASEISIKASSFDEPLTADSWFPVDASTRGCANLRAVKADKDGLFVQASGTGLFRISPDQQGVDYTSTDLMAMHEEICDGFEIVDHAVQRRPDTIEWLILSNGEARALTYEPAENVIAWSRVVTDGLFKRVAATRGAGQDSVHFAVVRNGTQRLERLADMKDCRGGALNCLADGFTRFTATAAQTTFSVPHLNGLQVTVWVDGAAVHNQSNLYTVSGNQVVIPPVALGKRVVIGLPYVGRWKSTKLAYGAQGGTALFMKKKVGQIGLYLINTILDGFRVGNGFDKLRKLTAARNDKPVVAGHLYEAFDADLMPISSDWDSDSRVCIEQKSPYPLTAAAMVLDISTSG